MAIVNGTLGPESTDAANSFIGAGCWMHQALVPAGDELWLTWLGRGNPPDNPLSYVGGGSGIVETCHVQKAPGGTVNVRIVKQLNLSGSNGVTMGEISATSEGVRCCAGEIIRSSRTGALTPSDIVIIDCTAATVDTDVMLIVREDI